MRSGPGWHRQPVGVLRRFAVAAEAVTLVEYSVILGFVSIAAVAVVALLGPKVSDMFQIVVDAFTGG